MKLLRILLLAISLTTSLFVRAYDFEANGLYFDIISTGDLTCALAKGPTPYTGALVIPDEVEYSGKKLKVISINAYDELNRPLTEVSSVQFGKYITKIPMECFIRNKYLSSITIPSTIKEIDSRAFCYCTSLTSVKWEGDMILSSGIFEGCTKLKNLSYKSICTTIPSEAFYECESLTSIDLSKVENIGFGAFYGCKSLNKIDLSSIKTIDTRINGSVVLYKGSFADCGKISLFILGENIETICTKIWKNCDIDSLVILPGNTSLEFRKIYSYDSSDQSYSDFRSANISIKGLYLGRTTTGIYCPFDGLELEHVRIGSSVSKLESYRYNGLSQGYFENCENLSNVIFDGNDITLGDECFYGTNIKEINLPKGKNVINRGVFPICVTSISLGSDVTFNDRPFVNCEEVDGLKRISCLSSTPPKGYQFYFSNLTYTSANLLVPYGSKEAYQNAEPWRNFWNIEEMPGVVTERVEITPTNTKIQVGDSLQLTGTRYPENSVDPIQWKSSDVKIATVSDAGLVKAVAPGKVTITATSGKASATCEVTVSPIAAQKILLNKDKVSVNVADTVKIIATVQPENTTDKTITWTSSDEKIATVSAEGIITAVKVGTATITATCGDIKATCEVTVLPITAEKIVLDLTEVSLMEADTITIKATITPETTTDKTITWTTSDEKVATVSAEGIVTAVSAGKATITATCGERSASCEVTVYSPNVNTEFAENTLTVTVEGSDKPVSVSIYSVMGQCIYQKTIEPAITVTEKIDCSSLAAGTYIVQIISGEMNTSKRIVK